MFIVFQIAAKMRSYNVWIADEIGTVYTSRDAKCEPYPKRSPPVHTKFAPRYSARGSWRPPSARQISVLPRHDMCDHWPIFVDESRCALCATGYSRIKCTKCDVYLCLSAMKNCFVSYHT